MQQTHEAKYEQINKVSSDFILNFDFAVLFFSRLNLPDC